MKEGCEEDDGTTPADHFGNDEFQSIFETKSLLSHQHLGIEMDMERGRRRNSPDGVLGGNSNSFNGCSATDGAAL